MSNVIPMRPFASALVQLQRAGQTQLRDEAARAIKRELAAGRNGMRVAHDLLVVRLAMMPRTADGAR